MGLNRQHQLQLIKDILTDHQLDCCGTVAEYEEKFSSMGQPIYRSEVKFPE